MSFRATSTEKYCASSTSNQYGATDLSVKLPFAHSTVVAGKHCAPSRPPTIRTVADGEHEVFEHLTVASDFLNEPVYTMGATSLSERVTIWVDVESI